MTKPERLSLATRLAQTHRSGDLVFWTAESWETMHAVHCVRNSPETVIVQVRTVGPASLDPGVQIRN